MNKKYLIAAMFLSATIMLQSISLLLVDAGYNANHSYIASALCINRDKPQMHCNGKCFLKKELSNQQEKDSSPRTIHSNSTVVLICEEISSYRYFHKDFGFIIPQERHRYSSGFLSTNERPPTC